MRESGASQEELEHVTARARQFYASRRSQSGPPAAPPVTQDGNQAEEATTAAAPNGDSTTAGIHVPTVAADAAPYPVSFEQIAEMIANGTPIPGIKEIPTVINDAQPTEARIATVEGAGKKPWER